MVSGRELHPDLDPEERRRFLREGVDLYRAGRYFDCHEAFEEVWRSTTPEPEDLWQGIIQVAVGLYHFRRGKPAVAQRVLAKGRRRLETFPSPSHGLDVHRLLEGVRDWERWLEETEGERPPEPELVVVDASALR